MSKRNGERQRKALLEERRKTKEQAEERKDHRNLTSQALKEQKSVRREYLEELIDTSKLQSETLTHLQALLSREFPLANLTDAQEHDIRHKLEVIKIKAYGIHPPQESYVTGDLRAFLYDDPAQNLQPLTGAERAEIDAFFETLKARITRGRHMEQQEMLNKQIAVSRTDESGDGAEDDGGLSLW